MKIAASVLISELNKSSLSIIQDLAKYIQSKKDVYELCKNSIAMEVSISTDDDFSVEGVSEFNKTYPVPEGEDSYLFFMDIWNNLNMNFGHRQYIKNNFDETLKSSDIKSLLEHNIDVSFGGNQTLDVMFVDVPKTMKLEDYEIDLTS